MFVPAIYTPCRFAEVCARTSITSICTRCDTRCGGPFARPATKRFPLPGRAIRRMSTWRVASAALFGEADLNMKKGRTPSTKVQGIRGLKSSGTQDESSGESFLKDSGEKAERAWESTKESAALRRRRRELVPHRLGISLRHHHVVKGQQAQKGNRRFLAARE